MSEHQQISKSSPPPGPDAPSAWVVSHAASIDRGGRVLDLACGRGRHARWLAGAGYRVLAVDRDAEALSALDGVAGVETLCRDLESGSWPLSGEHFAGIVVTRYLHRPLMNSLLASLLPGGILIYETFMVGNEACGRPANPDFLLRSGELLELAAVGRLDVLDFAEGLQAGEHPAVIQAICARRPRASG